MAEHSATGHHGSPDDDSAFTPEGAAYEHTDASVGPVAKFLFWLFIAAVLTHFGLAGVYKLLVDQGVKNEPSERRDPLAAPRGPAAPAGAAPAAVPAQRALYVPHGRARAARELRVGEQGRGHRAHPDR